MTSAPVIEMPASDKLIDLKIAHLNMLQSTVSRMAGYSASAKNYCVTILAAVVALSMQAGTARLVLGAAVATLLFSAMDLYYLSLELRFREAYADAARRLNDINMSIVPAEATRRHVLAAACSPSILMFYGPILAICLGAFLLAGAAPAAPVL